MTPSLATFPDRCLETIFKNTPLVDLYFSVGLVCRSWLWSRRTALTRHRHRLVLVDIAKQEQLNQYRVDCSTFGTEQIERVRREDGTPWHTHESQERFKFNLLFVPAGLHQIDPFFASLITNLPTITSLHVVHDCTASIVTGLIRLVDHLSAHLVDLKIVLSRPVIPSELDDGDRPFDDADLEDDDDDDDEEVITRDCAAKLVNLITSLNLLRSLRHLKLHLFFGNERLVLPPLTCLAHLTTFSFHIDEFRWVGDWFYTSVNGHARNVTAISLTSSRGAIAIPRILARIDHQLDPKFVSISAQLDDFLEPVLPVQRIDSLRQFSTRFSGLTKLELVPSFFSMPLTVLARCLSLLPQLVHLDLPFFTIPQLENFEYRTRGRQAQEVIAQVLSVRLLSLSFSTISHGNTERLRIAEIFPNLQVFRLEHRFYRCDVCGIVRRDDGEPHLYEDSPPELAPRIAECSRLARQPFRQCLHLHTLAIVHENTETLLSVAEM